MAIVTSIIGKSGSGKSTSFKGFVSKDGKLREDVFIIRPSKKPFPFKNKFKNIEEGGTDYFYTHDFQIVKAIMSKAVEDKNKKIIIIEDSTFFMTDYFMETANVKGYQKFTDLAAGYFYMLKHAENLPDNIRVYVINHIDLSTEIKRVKTIGKLLDDKIDIPSLLTVVLEATKTDNGFRFLTNKRVDDDISKSPEGMFEDLYIDNNLNVVDKSITEYYDIK